MDSGLAHSLMGFALIVGAIVWLVHRVRTRGFEIERPSGCQIITALIAFGCAAVGVLFFALAGKHPSMGVVLISLFFMGVAFVLVVVLTLWNYWDLWNQ